MKKVSLIFALISLAILATACSKVPEKDPQIEPKTTEENSWLCENGEWVKQGNPSIPAPTGECKKEETEILYEEKVEEMV